MLLLEHPYTCVQSYHRYWKRFGRFQFGRFRFVPNNTPSRRLQFGGVSTVLVEFKEGPKGVFMLADDESKNPEIDGLVRFEVRRLYGQDGLMHYGLKAVLC